MTVLDRATDALVGVAFWLDQTRDKGAAAVFGPRCRYGCGQRIYPRDCDRHEALDHGGDEL